MEFVITMNRMIHKQKFQKNSSHCEQFPQHVSVAKGEPRFSGRDCEAIPNHKEQSLGTVIPAKAGIRSSECTRFGTHI